MLTAYGEPPARLEVEVESSLHKEEEEVASNNDVHEDDGGWKNNRRPPRGGRDSLHHHCGARPLPCLPWGPIRALSRVWTNCWYCFSDYGEAEAVVDGRERWGGGGEGGGGHATWVLVSSVCRHTHTHQFLIV